MVWSTLTPTGCRANHGRGTADCPSMSSSSCKKGMYDLHDMTTGLISPEFVQFSARSHTMWCSCVADHVRTLAKAWLHGVFLGEWLFVFPLCGFSLSLFCNYSG